MLISMNNTNIAIEGGAAGGGVELGLLKRRVKAFDILYV